MKNKKNHGIFLFYEYAPKNLKGAMKNRSIFLFENEIYNYFIFIGSLYSFGNEDEIKN